MARYGNGIGDGCRVRLIRDHARRGMVVWSAVDGCGKRRLRIRWDDGLITEWWYEGKDVELT